MVQSEYRLGCIHQLFVEKHLLAFHNHRGHVIGIDLIKLGHLRDELEWRHGHSTFNI